jgi:hypothetical protein
MASNQKSLAKTKAPSKRDRLIKEEDDFLISYYNGSDDQNFNNISTFLPTRTTKQARERWANYLNPNLEKDQKLTFEEEKLLEYLVKHYGRHWNDLMKFFPGISPVTLRNTYNNLYNKVPKEENKLTLNQIKFH